MLRHTIAILIALAVLARPAWSDVQEYEDFTQWQSAAGSFTTIGFDEIPVFSFVTTQYSDLGVTFVDGSHMTVGPSSTYPQDGFGLDGNGPISLDFMAPMSSIAVHHPGTVQFQLFSNGKLVYESSGFQGAPSGINGFAGLVLSDTFDGALIFRPTGAPVFIDNLYFGPPIPAPGAVAALVCGFLTAGSRRRS